MDITAETKGLIFNIQKFSVNDGPGIRTVVFFKGCPLRCKWCANPESQNRRIQTALDDKKRIVYGEWKSVDEVLKICLQDMPFYEESNGGVTLSGGEVLSSPGFAESLMTALHEHDVHVALETTGYATPDIFDRVTQHADLLLFDMKHWNEEKHIEGTGVSNLPILANMKRAVENGIKVLPRIPVIPGFNDVLTDAKGFADRLHEVDLSRAQLLPFHQFGENKYHLLNQEYSYADIDALHPEDLEEYRKTLIKNGIDAFF